MKKLITLLLIIFCVSAHSQVTPSSIIRAANSTTAFNETVPAGKNIVDNGNGKQYLVLLPLVGTKTIATCTLGTDIRDISLWPLKRKLFGRYINGSENMDSVITDTYISSAAAWNGKQSAILVKTSAGNKTYYPLFSNTSSGVIDSVIVKTDKLSFNPSTGNLTATIFQLSDRRYKNHIKPLTWDDYAKIAKIDFHKAFMNDDPTNKQHYVVVAQEVEKVLPELVDSSNPDKKTVNYQELLLLKIAQLEQIIQDQEKRLTKLERKNKWQSKQMIIK